MPLATKPPGTPFEKDVPPGMELVFVKKGFESKQSRGDFLILGKFGPLKSAITQLGVYLDWNDQGWGNSKGAVKVMLVSTDRGEDELGNSLTQPSDILAEVVIKPAPKKCERTTKTLDENSKDSSLCRESDQGHWLLILYRVGGGGGHRLEIKQAGVAVKWLDDGHDTISDSSSASSAKSKDSEKKRLKKLKKKEKKERKKREKEAKEGLIAQPAYEQPAQQAIYLEVE